MSDHDYVLWDQKETAEALRRPVNTLKDWRAKAKGPRSAVIGGKVMYRKSDVLAWIDECFAESARGANVKTQEFKPLGKRSLTNA